MAERDLQDEALSQGGRSGRFHPGVCHRHIVYSQPSVSKQAGGPAQALPSLDQARCPR